MRRLGAVVLTTLVVVACGGDDDDDASGGGAAGRLIGEGAVTFVEVEPPATVTGRLEITVEEGPVGSDELSEINFGSISTDEGQVLIELEAEIVRAAGLTRDDLLAGPRVSAALEAPEYEVTGVPSYRIVSIEMEG